MMKRSQKDLTISIESNKKKRKKEKKYIYISIDAGFEPAILRTGNGSLTIRPADQLLFKKGWI